MSKRSFSSCSSFATGCFSRVGIPAAMGLALLVSISGPSMVNAQDPDSNSQTTEQQTKEKEQASDVSSVFPLLRPITSFGAAKIGDVIYAYGGNIDTPHEYYKGCQSGQLLRLDLSKSEPAWEVISEDDQLQGVALCSHGDHLYRIGGFTATNAQGEPQSLHSLASFKRFDTKSGKWQELPDLPEGRSSLDAYVIGDRLFVIGGWDMNGDDATHWHDDALVCDLSEETLTWESLPEPGFERRAIAVAQHGNHLIVVGGMNSDEETTTAVNLLDLGTMTWKEGPKLPGKDLHGFGAAAATVDGQAVVSMMSGKTYRLNDQATEWTLVDSTESGRFFHRLIPVEGKVLSIGGTSMQTGKFDDCSWISLQETTEK